MRAAPPKGDCLICQSPEPTRVSINAAIWPGDGIMRSVTYRADAVEVARNSRVPELATLNVKTVTRHVEHVESTWRDVPPGGRLRPDELPVASDFAAVTEQGSRLGAKAMQRLESFLDEHGDVATVMMTKEVIAIAKLGLGAAGAKEASRLKRNQQAIDVAAIFGLSSGHVTARPAEPEDETLEDLRSTVAAERALLAERAGL